MRIVGMGFLILGLCFFQACASEQASVQKSAQAAPKSASQTDWDIFVSKLKADKKYLVAQNMELTDGEAAKFWPLYDRYQDELMQINERLGRTISEYVDASSKGPLPDATASKLLDDALAVEESEIALKRGFAEQLGQVLPDTKVARYMQLETKIRSVVKYELARLIPLAY